MITMFRLGIFFENMSLRASSKSYDIYSLTLERLTILPYTILEYSIYSNKIITTLYYSTGGFRSLSYFKILGNYIGCQIVHSNMFISFDLVLFCKGCWYVDTMVSIFSVN
jgi:hypothetical protein